MKVIFLDFDGVITSPDTKWKIDMRKINIINDIVNSFSSIKHNIFLTFLLIINLLFLYKKYSVHYIFLNLYIKHKKVLENKK